MEGYEYIHSPFTLTTKAISQKLLIRPYHNVTKWEVEMGVFFSDHFYSDLISPEQYLFGVSNLDVLV